MEDPKKPLPPGSQPTASRPDPRVATVYADSRPLLRDGMLRDILASQKEISKIALDMIQRQRDILSKLSFGHILSFSILLLVLAIWSQLLEISATVKTLQEGQQLCAGGPLD